MLSCCKEAVANVPGRDWCVLIQKELHQEMMERLHPMGCDLLVCHIVLHLFEPKKQVSLLRLLAQCIADNGLLLLSGYSEPSDQNAHTADSGSGPSTSSRPKSEGRSGRGHTQQPQQGCLFDKSAVNVNSADFRRPDTCTTAVSRPVLKTLGFQTTRRRDQ